MFVFQLSLKGPPGPLGLPGRPGPHVRHSSDLDQIWIITKKFLQPLISTSCWTGHKLHSLLPILNSSLCLISLFKLIVTILQGIKKRFLRWFILSSFIFCCFGAKFEWRVQLLLYIMSWFDEFDEWIFTMQGVPGSSGFKGDLGDSGPPVRPDISFSSLLASDHAVFTFLVTLFYVFFHLSWSLPLSNRDHMGCRVPQDLMES